MTQTLIASQYGEDINAQLRARLAEFNIVGVSPGVPADIPADATLARPSLPQAWLNRKADADLAQLILYQYVAWGFGRRQVIDQLQRGRPWRESHPPA